MENNTTDVGQRKNRRMRIGHPYRNGGGGQPPSDENLPVYNCWRVLKGFTLARGLPKYHDCEGARAPVKKSPVATQRNRPALCGQRPSQRAGKKKGRTRNIGAVPGRTAEVLFGRSPKRAVFRCFPIAEALLQSSATTTTFSFFSSFVSFNFLTAASERGG